MLSFDEVAYTAGIIDGEGYIGIIKRVVPYGAGYNFDLRVSVTMCNSLIPSWLHANFGGTYNAFQPPSLNRKKLYAWRMQGQAAGDFLKLVLPYLKMKQGEAKIGIELQSYRARKYCMRKRKPIAVLEAEVILHKKLKELHERQYSEWKLGA